MAGQALPFKARAVSWQRGQYDLVHVPVRCGHRERQARCAPSPACGGGLGWGRTGTNLRIAPTLTLQPKSDVSDFGQSISGRTQVNLSSAASGGGNAPSVLRGLCINLIETWSSVHDGGE